VQFGATSLNSAVNGKLLVASVIPACAKDDWSEATSSSIDDVPAAYTKGNDSLAPAGMPAPHWFGPSPGRTQLSVPIGQLALVTLSLAWVWVVGLRCLWRSLLFVLFALTTGLTVYYLGAAYAYLLAAGAVAIDGWLQARPGRLRNLMLATAVITAVALPLILPVLPPAGLGRAFAKANPDSLESIGRPQLVRTVDAVWASLPPSQRASAVVFTDSYADAGGHQRARPGDGTVGRRQQPEQRVVVGAR
jgi:hypothetical protein